nr:subclass B2 metallo-beta-lactamase [uncultured bacterium]
MNKIITLALFSSIVTASFDAFSNENPKPSVSLTHVAGNIYVAEDTFYVKENTVVYVGEKSVTVISATWTPETAKLLVDEIKKVTNKPIGVVVNTHSHLDRTGGNAYFKGLGATILATKQTSQLMKKNWDQSLKAIKKSFPSFPDVPLVLPDITFKDRHDLESGKIQLLYLGPSHTEDQIVAYFPEEKVLDGDCALKEQLGNLSEANIIEYPKTLARMKKLPIQTIIAGHWSPVHGPELIDKYIELLKNNSIPPVAK